MIIQCYNKQVLKEKLNIVNVGENIHVNVQFEYPKKIIFIIHQSYNILIYNTLII